MTTTEETEAREREERMRDIARREAEMAARTPSPFDDTGPLTPGWSQADWREVPKGWYAVPVCDWIIFGDMVGPGDEDEPEPVAPLMGYLLVARKTERHSRSGRITGRDGLVPVRLVAAENAVAPVGFTRLTPYQRLHDEIEGSYHEADHPQCELPDWEKRDDGKYYQVPGCCRWHYGPLGERRWGFPATREGAERWRNAVAELLLEDIKEHGTSRYRALYGQLTDPKSREIGIGPDCRGSR